MERSRLRSLTGALLVMAIVAIAASVSPTLAQTPEPWVMFGHDNATSMTVNISTINGLAVPLGPTGFASGASGYASSRADLTASGGVVYQKGTIFGLLRDETFNKDYAVAVRNETGYATKLVETDLSIGGRGVGFGADGKTFYVIVPPGELLILGLDDGAITRIGEVRDASGTQYSSVSLEWEPNSQTFLAFAGPNTSTLISIDPDTAQARPLGTLSNFGACTVTRAPGPIAGPGGTVFPEGTLFAINNETNDLHAVTVDVAAGAILDNQVIGGLGPNATGVCGTAFALPELPTETPTSTPSITPTFTPSLTPSVTPTYTPSGTTTPAQTHTPRPTWTPVPTRTPRPTPSATTTYPQCVCKVVYDRVPAVVINDALANPERFYGWQLPLDQGKPPSPANPPRECLSLMNVSMPYHLIWNKPIWRVGCP